MVKELLTSLLLLGVAITYFYLALQINQSALADDFGAAGLPLIYSYLLGSVAIALIAKQALAKLWSSRRAARATSDANLVGRAVLRSSGMLAIGVAYLLVVPFIGYLLSIICTIGSTAWYQGERLGLRLALISIAGGLVFFLFFVVVLGIDMPPGILARRGG